MSTSNDEDPAVSRFREYLRINTVSLPTPDAEGPHPNYDAAVKFLCNQADEIGLVHKCIEVYPNRPVLILTWLGKDHALPTIMLNSHMDVVPVFPEHWESDPFAACKRQNGDIVARGSQDMKCVGMWYLEAIRRLKAEGVVLKRTLHITFVPAHFLAEFHRVIDNPALLVLRPDEEVGGKYGMSRFVQHEEFRKMNVAYCLDEGLANPDNFFTVFYGERVAWWITVTCFGPTGHGSRLMENIAVEKMHKFLSLVLEFRDEQIKRLSSDPTLTLGDVTSVNPNVLKGGVQYNVIPAEVSVGLDFRISPQDSHQELEKKVQSWVKSVGGKMEVTVEKTPPIPLTSTDSNDPWWSAFSSAIDKHNIGVKPEIFPAGTDSRFVRTMGVPALGFSAMRNTPILLHEHNEFLNEKVYLEGIPIYRDIIFNLANV